MSYLRALGLSLAALLLAVAVAISSAGAAGAGDRPAYLNPNLSPETRAADLLGRMSLAEKVGQMTQLNVTSLRGVLENDWDGGPFSPDILRFVFDENMTGSILSGGGAGPERNTPRDWALMTNELQRYAIEHHPHGIPIIYGVDAVHGHNNVLGATMFPHQFGLGAAYEPGLVKALGHSTARAVRATGIHWNFAPVADVWRDLRWGRSYEPFSEDPFVASELVAASVRGQEGRNLASSESVAATVKHFIGYSAPDSGRDRENATLDERELRDVHLPAFRSAVDAGVETAMINSGSVNGVPVHASEPLINGLLRTELGFGGLVVTDWEDIIKLVTVHRFAPNMKEAIRMAINAGIDMSMVPYARNAKEFTGLLTELVNEGGVPQSRVDDAVLNILTVKFRLGLFERPYVDADRANRVVEDADLDLARESAAETMTLLENDGTLPLKRRKTDVLVTGPSADNVPNQLGGWSIGWQGVPPDQVPEATTVREGVEDAVGDAGRVRYVPGVPAAEEAGDPDAVAEARDQAVRRARTADVVVAVVGEPPYAEGPGDTTTAALPAPQPELLDALAETGTPVVIVVIAGRPLMMREQIRDAAATLMAYLPGTEGGSAVADVLFGKENPSGRLSVTWPKRVDQAPMTYDRLPGEPYDPLYAFGHGLSYTRFDYRRLEGPWQASRGGWADVSVRVRNSGRRAGEHTVLLFARRVDPSAAFPARKLVAFEKVWLRPGERRRVDVSFPVRRLAVTEGGTTAVQAGRYELLAGGLREGLTIR
jgi:beta-glucosidase